MQLLLQLTISAPLRSLREIAFAVAVAVKISALSVCSVVNAVAVAVKQFRVFRGFRGQNIFSLFRTSEQTQLSP